MRYKIIVLLLFVALDLKGCFSNSCVQNFSKVEQGRRCRKPCKVNDDCKSPNKSCECDGACGMSCFNPEAECLSGPTNILNGRFIRSNGNLIHSNATYSCDPGYTLNGTATTICFADKSWHPKAPACDRTKCLSDPQNIPYGRYKTKDENYLNSRATYSCRKGFILKGNRRTYCREDRNWHPEPPSCIPGCDRPRPERFAYVSSTKSSFLTEESVIYKCQTGRYQSNWKVINMTRKCMNTGIWSTAEFNCDLQMCTDLPEALNGRIYYFPDRSDVHRFGDSARLDCYEGYTPTDAGAVTSRCINGDRGSSLGRWTRRELSRCQKIPCPPPRSPINGYIQYQAGHRNEYDSTITYGCHFGYTLEGSSQGRCNENGTWGDMPQCLAAVNCSFTQAAIPTCGYRGNNWGRVITWQSQFAESSSAKASLTSPVIGRQYTESDLVCLKFKYNLSPRGSLSIKLMRDDRQLWSSHPNETRNEWKSSFVNIRVIGNIQYKFAAEGRSLKLDDIFLNKDDCEEPCLSSPCLHGGTCVNRPDTFECYCTEEYKGTVCDKEITCSRPSLKQFQVLLNGPRNGQWKVGEEAAVKCEEGHTFVNSSPKNRIICTQSGQWNTEFTGCGVMSCPEPREPEYGFIMSRNGNGNVVGSSVKYGCGFGYLLDGDRDVYCNEHGTWGELPICGALVNCSFDENKHPTCGYRSRYWKRKSSSGSKYAESQYDEAILTSSFIARKYSDSSYACLNFTYNLPRYGKLIVKIMLGEQSGQTIWSSNKNDAPSTWLKSEVNIPVNEKIRYQFIANRRSIKLDAIFLNRHQCGSHCVSNPCHHGGTCVAKTDDYECLCEMYYKGPTCQIAVVNCSFSDENVPTCGYRSNSWRRAYNDRFGYAAESSSNDATLTSPLITRQEAQSSHRCLSFRYNLPPTGSLKVRFVGGRQNDKSLWSSQRNENKSVWLESFVNIPVGDWGEETQYQFVADRASLKLDDIFLNEEECASSCNSDPCLNEGTCVDRPNGFECFCSVGYKGNSCEFESSCNSNPCLNGGTCVEQPDGFDCLCTIGYKGYSCEIEGCKRPNVDPLKQRTNAIQSVYGVNQVITISCLETYYYSDFTQSRNHTCTESGSWTPSISGCTGGDSGYSAGAMINNVKPSVSSSTNPERCIQEKPCCYRPSINIMKQRVKTGYQRWYRLTQMVTIDCTEPFKYSDHSNSRNYTCGEGGLWSPEIMRCFRA